LAAVRGVERVAAAEQLVEFVLEGGELALAVSHLGELGGEERFDVAARCGADAAHLEDSADLAEREIGGLGAADETEPGEGGVVVVAIAAGGAGRFAEQPAFLIEPHGLNWQVDSGGELSDAHVPTLSP